MRSMKVATSWWFLTTIDVLAITTIQLPIVNFLKVKQDWNVPPFSKPYLSKTN